MLLTAVNYKGGPIALRYPRGNASGFAKKEMKQLQVGKGEIIRKGSDVAIAAVGVMVSHSMQAADILEKEGIDAEVINMRFVKPIDKELIENIAGRFDEIITVEDNTVEGGFGSAVLEMLQQIGKPRRVLSLGLPDEFVEHGTPQQLYEAGWPSSGRNCQ